MLTVRLDQVKKTVLLIFLPSSKQLMTRHKVIVLQLVYALQSIFVCIVVQSQNEKKKGRETASRYILMYYRRRCHLRIN